MKSLLVLVFLLVGETAVRTQSIDGTEPGDIGGERPAAAIKAFALPGTESIRLRWIPTRNAAFRHGRNVGYHVDRAEVIRGRPGAYVRLTERPVLPWTQAEWHAYTAAPREDTLNEIYCEVAYSLLEEMGEDASSVNPEKNELAMLVEARRRELTRFGILLISADLHRAAASGIGLSYNDRNITPSKEYLYRITTASPHPTYDIAPGGVRVKAERFDPSIHKGELRFDGLDGKILIGWRRDTLLSCYYIERARRGQSEFTPLNKEPYVAMRPGIEAREENSFLDTSVVNGIQYAYRVIGVSRFAEKHIVGEIVASSRDGSPPPRPILETPKHTSPRAVTLRWKIEDHAGSDLKGFTVGRDTLYRGAFPRIHEGLLGPDIREYADTAYAATGRNYYTVFAVDTAGNISASNPAYAVLIDSTPPAAPRWVGGTMDTMGIVTLTLRRNTEHDFMGYRILRGNDPSHEFVVSLESFTDGAAPAGNDTTFTDTLTVRSLSPSIYYQATALDRNHNESAVSEVLEVHRPDMIPPVPPVILDVFVTDSSVSVSWIPSGSRDAGAHILFRRSKSDTAWRKLAVFDAKEHLYIDENIRKSVEYLYALRAIDSSGQLSAMSNIVPARPYDTGVRPGLRDVMARYDSAAKKIQVGWTRPRTAEAHELFLYRSIDGAPLMRRAIISDQAQNTWNDDHFPLKGTIAYRIILRTQDGGRSRLSDPVTVTLKQD